MGSRAEHVRVPFVAGASSFRLADTCARSIFSATFFSVSRSTSYSASRSTSVGTSANPQASDGTYAFASTGTGASTCTFSGARASTRTSAGPGADASCCSGARPLLSLTSTNSPTSSDLPPLLHVTFSCRGCACAGRQRDQRYRCGRGTGRPRGRSPQTAQAVTRGE